MESSQPIQVTFFKSINYAPFPLTVLSQKAKILNQLKRKEKVVNEQYGYEINLFSWFAWKNSITLQRLLSPINYWLFANKIKQFVLRNSIDLIHAHTFSPDAYIAYQLKKSFGIDYVLTMRMRAADKLENHPLRQKIVENAKAVICHNYQLYKLYGEKYNVQFLPHGLSQEFFHDTPKRVSELEFNEQRPLKLLTVGRLLGLKNIDVVIKAVRKMKNEGRMVTYTIIGEGPEKTNLTQLIQDSDLTDCINLVPWQKQTDLIAYYDNADVFVMVSKPETFGRVYLEAAARGLPIVACKNTGIDGFFTELEVSFAEPNTDSIKGLLVQFYNAPELSLQKQKFAKHKVDSLSWSKVVKKYYNIYTKID